MKRLLCAAVSALALLVACGGGSSGVPNAPFPMISSGPITSASENVAPSSSTTTAPLPSIDGIYGGQIILPPGTGTATLTFSVNPPPGVNVLTELTPSPQVAYITLTAQSAFTLNSAPGLNLTVPVAYTTIVIWLNYYGSSGWSSRQVGWPGETSNSSDICFAAQGNAVSLQPGQSLYLGINGDDIIPTPTVVATPPACPQPA